MPSCAIKTCRSHSRNINLIEHGVSYHRFPQTSDIKEKWINATGRADWFPTKYSTICSKHFDDSDFIVKTSGNRYLKADAVPQGVSCPKPCCQRKKSGKSHLSNENHDTGENHNHHNEESSSGTLARRKVQSSKSNSNDVSKQRKKEVISSKLTPTQRESKLEHIIATKDKFILRQRKQLKKIQGQNRKLNKRIIELEKLLYDKDKQISPGYESVQFIVE